MICRLKRAILLSVVTGAIATPAVAQNARTVIVEAMTDEERRGLSWTEGRAALAGDILVPLGPLDASARAVTTRGSARHDGADAVVDLAIGTGWDLGAVRIRADAIRHAFAGARGNMDYVEASLSASYSYGPLYGTLGVVGAPSQKAIGGSNVYVFAKANAGIPGTPFTVLAEVGHSSGSVRDADRAERLRPGGDYSNWRLGLEHRRDRLTVGLDYVGTDVSRTRDAGRFADLRHAGDRIIGRAQLSF